MTKVDDSSSPGLDSDGMELQLIEPTTSIHTTVFEGDNDLDIPITLHQAAREGDADYISNHLHQQQINSPKTKQEKNIINERDAEKCAPLHYAARYHHLDCVQILVEHGANVNIRGEDGVTPLHSTAHHTRHKRKRRQSCLQPTPPELRHDGTAVDWSTMYRDESAAVTTGGIPSPQDDEKETITMVKLLVGKGAEVNSQDEYGLTPLHYAARRGNTATAKALLGCALIEIEHTDKQEQTPLHTACAYNQYSIVQLLLSRGAIFNAIDADSCTPLHLACMTGNVKIVNALFSHALERKGGQVALSEMVSHSDTFKGTPLHVAIQYNHLKVAKLCIHNGSNINTHNCTDRNTPLHLAAKVGDVDIVELLVAHGAHIDAVNSKQKTPLHSAARYDRPEVCKFLIQKGALLECRDEDGFTPLLLGALYGHVTVLATLLEHGANVYSGDKDGKTVIYWAAADHNLEVLEALLQLPGVAADGLIDRCDWYENSPLHVAAQKGHVRIVKSLLDHGAVPNLKNDNEQTPIHLACRYGRTNVVRVLLEDDENCIREEDQDRNTPLHMAAWYGHEEVAAILIEAGAYPEDSNVKQWTPLFCAADGGRVKAARLLLEQRSPVDPMDKTKTTPLLLASQKGHTEVVELLLKWKARVSHRDTDGQNCLDVAIDNNHENVALAIVNSDEWKGALRNESVDPATGMRNTPLRKLIRQMPDVAKRVFQRCTEDKNRPEDPKYTIIFDYEFLDDTYRDWKDLPSADTSASLDIEDNKPNPDAKPYHPNSNIVKRNHPLMIMVSSEREDLLGHLLVTSLLRHKWNKYARYFYYTNLAMYLVFLANLTAYIVITRKPTEFYANDRVNVSSSCKDIQSAWSGMSRTIESPWWEAMLKYVILVLCGLQLIRELFQICHAKLNYFGVENVFEWLIYGFSIYLVVDWDQCQRETNLRNFVQWQFGAIAIFLAWIELVLFIRKVPRFGMYILMFTDVLNTFISFSFVFFLFIIAFALSFYALMANQTSFDTVGSALIKTSVMMIGEFDFDTMFNDRFGDENDHSLQVYFSIATYMIFALFLVVMSIILMNLLVGLAVDNIKAVRDQAELKRLAMQVTLALDVETFVPEFFRRRFSVRTLAMQPNKARNKTINIVKRNLNMKSQLSATEIRSALHPENDQMEERMKRLEAMMKAMRQQVKRVDSNVKDMNEMMDSNMEKIVGMMETMMAGDISSSRL